MDFDSSVEQGHTYFIHCLPPFEDEHLPEDSLAVLPLGPLLQTIP